MQASFEQVAHGALPPLDAPLPLFDDVPVLDAVPVFALDAPPVPVTAGAKTFTFWLRFASESVYFTLPLFLL